MAATADDVDLREVLYSLLYRRAFRDAFVRGGPDDPGLGLEPAQRAALVQVDLEELSRTAARVQSMVLRGHVEGHGGLRSAFPRVLTVLEQRGVVVGDLVADFLADDEFAEFREVPYGIRGVTLEEAFHRFVHRLPGTDADLGFLADHEFLVATVRNIATGALATFDVRSPLVRHNGTAWFGVLEHRAARSAALGLQPSFDGTALYAAGSRGTVTGPCPRWLPDVLDQPGHAEAVAQRHGISEAAVHAAAARLRAIGLLA